MKNTKEQKKKPYRSAWSNAVWSFKGMLCNAPQSFWLMTAGVPLAIFIAWSEIKLPALVVSEVTQKQTFTHAAIAVGTLIVLTFAAAALKDFCSTVLEAYLNKYRYNQSIRIEKKSMSCFYQEYEKNPCEILQDEAVLPHGCKTAKCLSAKCRGKVWRL